MSKHRGNFDYDEEDDYTYDNNSFTDDYMYGKSAEEELSRSMELRYGIQGKKKSPGVSDFIKSPVFKEVNFNDVLGEEVQETQVQGTEEQMKECIDFLKANGGDFEDEETLRKIVIKNNYDLDKCLYALESGIHEQNDIDSVKQKYSKEEQEQYHNQQNYGWEGEGNGEEYYDEGYGYYEEENVHHHGYEYDGKSHYNQIKKQKEQNPKAFQTTEKKKKPKKIQKKEKKGKGKFKNAQKDWQKLNPKKNKLRKFNNQIKNEEKMSTQIQKKKTPTVETKVVAKPPKFNKKFEEDKEKQRLNVVVIGHVDAGKSTMMGKLFVVTGNVKQKRIEKFEKEASEIGKSSFYLAWVFDEQSEERSRGVTVDIGTKFFDTKNRKITILDAPGHKDFIPNMIMGTGQADVAILVIDSIKGAFEAGFSFGGQTREHLIVAKCYGIREIIVAVNKMDCVSYSEKRFLEIKEKVLNFTKSLGFKENVIHFIPVCGIEGENLKEKGKNLAWYQGKTLLDTLDMMNPKKRKNNIPLRLCISDFYKDIHSGLTITGTIDSGTMKKGEKLIVMPIKEVFSVKSIQRNNQIVKTAYAGDNVQLGISGIKESSLHVGQIICETKFPITYFNKIKVTLITFDLKEPIIKGTQVIVHIQNIKVEGTIRKLCDSYNKKTKKFDKHPRLLKKNATANVILKLDSDIGVELFKDNKSFGRLILRREGRTIASGIVVKILNKKKKFKKKERLFF